MEESGAGQGCEGPGTLSAEIPGHSGGNLEHWNAERNARRSSVQGSRVEQGLCHDPGYMALLAHSSEESGSILSTSLELA